MGAETVRGSGKIGVKPGDFGVFHHFNHGTNRLSNVEILSVSAWILANFVSGIW